MESSKTAKYDPHRISGVVPRRCRGGVIYRNCDFFVFSFCFSGSRLGYTDWPLFAQKHSIAAEWRKEVALGVVIFNFWNSRVFHPKQRQKGAWLGILSANENIEYLDIIFTCFDRLSPNCTGKCRKAKCILELFKNAKFWKSKMAAAAILDLLKC